MALVRNTAVDVEVNPGPDPFWCTGVDKQPQLWHNPWAGLYVVAVCFFLGLFWVNLLQGAIIDNYCRLIEEMGTSALVSKAVMLCCAVLRYAVLSWATLYCCCITLGCAMLRCPPCAGCDVGTWAPPRSSSPTSWQTRVPKQTPMP